MSLLRLAVAAFALLMATACNSAEFASPARRERSLQAPAAKNDPSNPKDVPGDDDNDNHKPGTADDAAGDDDDDDDDGPADPTDPDGPTPEEIQEEIDAIPGQPVVRLGVNFEDAGISGDRDYNDAVLCFEGKFKANGADVVSIAEQEVIGTTSSISGCHHAIRVEIVHADGTREAPIGYDSRATEPVRMKFKVGSKLEVFMTPYQGCNEGVERNMHSDVDARVLPNTCNTTGD